MVDVLGGALSGHLVVFTQESRQLEGLQVMVEQQLGRLAHGGPGINAVYRFEHIMELAVALLFHRQAILKKDTIVLLAQLRDELTPIYRRAWLEQDRGLGSRASIKVGQAKPFTASGIWLDLGLRYSPGQVLTTTGPKPLGPAGAVRELVRVDRQRYFRDPINISDLAAAVVKHSKKAPEVRRGRR